MPLACLVLARRLSPVCRHLEATIIGANVPSMSPSSSLRPSVRRPSVTTTSTRTDDNDDYVDDNDDDENDDGDDDDENDDDKS